MEGNVKDFGIFLPLVICMKFWGFATFPIYWLAKQRRKTKYTSSCNECPAVRLQYSDESILLIPRQIKDAVTMFTQGKDCDRTLSNFMSWVYGQYPDRPCMGARKVLGITKGEAFGKPIDIISQSPNYERLTYRQIQEKVDNIARGLMSNYNVEKGSKVFIFAKTRMEWMISILACWGAGTVATTFYTTSQDEEIGLVLGQAMPKLIITEVEWIARLEKILQKIGHKDKVKIITMDSKEDAGINGDDLFILEKAGSEACDEKPLPKQARDELALIMFTSGTNGHPKGVLFTHEQVVWGVTEMSQKQGNFFKHEFDSGDSNMVCLPLAHIFQLSGVLGGMANGLCSDFGSPFTLVNSSPSVAPGEKGDLLVSSPHAVPMVPLLAQRMKAGIEKAVSQRGKSFRLFFDYCLDYKASWMQKGYNTPILNFLMFNRIKNKIFGGKLGGIACGGSAMPKEVICFMRTLCFPDCYVGQGYGATEIMAAGTCQVRYSQLDDSIGHSSSNTLVMIKSWEERGYTIHDEEGPSGEMLIGGAQVAQGYLGQAMEDEGESFFTDQNGMRWFRTGDIVRLDQATNAVSIIDRKKQLIKLLNGKYISLAKIELAMVKLDWIDTACVVTRSDKQQLAAIVVHDWSVLEKFKETLDNEEVKLLVKFERELTAKMQDELDGFLARYVIPRILHLAQGPWTPDTGLVTPTLKIKRHAIQKEFELQISDMMKQIN